MLQGENSYSTSGYLSYTRVKIHFSLPIHKYNISLWLTTTHTWSCQSGTLTQIPPLHFGISSVLVHKQHIWPHQTVTHKLQSYPNHKGLASLQPGFLIKFDMSFDVTLPTALEATLATPHSGYLYHTTQMMSLSFHQAVLWILTLLTSSFNLQQNKSYN